MPDGMRDRIAERADKAGRSMNAELVLIISQVLDLDDLAQPQPNVVALLEEQTRLLRDIAGSLKRS
jgi:plasmid stability protein